MGRVNRRSINKIIFHHYNQDFLNDSVTKIIYETQVGDHGKENSRILYVDRNGKKHQVKNPDICQFFENFPTVQLYLTKSGIIIFWDSYKILATVDMKNAVILRKYDTPGNMEGCIITNFFEKNGEDYIGAMTSQSHKTDTFFQLETSVDKELNIQWKIYPTDEP